MTVLPITLTMAGAATLLNIWIAQRVGKIRMAQKISIGDGGNPALTARMRAHANFVEYTPFFLILLALIELAQGSALWLWLVGAAYILGRLAHVFGMDAQKPGKLRMIGIVTTMLILLGLALYALAIPYFMQPRPAPISYAEAQPR